MSTNKTTQDFFDEGFNDDSIRALYLIPVITTAWADGKVQVEEKEEILRLLENRSIQKTSEAYRLVESWLTKKPVDEFFNHATSLVQPLFTELQENRGGSSDWVVEACRRVAMATGSKKNPISPGEEKVLLAISGRLRSRAAA